ncbi:MAG: hypothetical protein JEZ09_05520 [Salinivirgaceae bacterium]|nr:hypothetical protein [Salinivirgaceae bacterium]
MMKKATLFLVIAFVFASISSVNAQKNKFEKSVEKDGVTFLYKWKPSELFKKDSPLALVIKIENKNEYDIKANFEVIYYWKLEPKATSNEQEAIVKSKQIFTKNVKKKGFDTYEFTKEEIKDDEFYFDIVEIKIEKIVKEKK